MRTVKILSLILFCLLPLLASGCSGDSGAEPPPNIVFVILDAARADHFSGYGYQRPTTPEIDRIGEKGAVFLNNFVPATETHTVMPLIMSSRYFSRPIWQYDGWRWGIREETPESIFRDFDDQQILLPAFLSGVGYRTAIFHNHSLFGDRTELARDFDEYFHFSTASRGPVDEAMVGEILSWIERNQNGPFFVYYHVMSPHQPFPAKAQDALFINPGEEAALAAAREKFNSPGGRNGANWTSDELYYFRVMYDSNLAHSDLWVGRLYAGLEDLGLEKNTLFIITSDHGTLLGEHGRLTYGDFPPWDGAIHVPLVMSGPGRIPDGLRVSALTESVDIFPAIVDLAGLVLPPGKDLAGRSLRELFTNPEAGRDAVYVKNAVRTADYKYMFDRDLFFDLRNDPDELNNIADFQPPAFKEELRRAYERFMEPHRERYREAVRKVPPSEPFYFPVNAFEITPESGYRVSASRNLLERILDGPPPAEPWQLSTSGRWGYLVLRPGEEAPPNLRLAAPLIDGDYLVSILISLLEGHPFPSEGRGFRIRTGSDGLFRSPVTVSPLSVEDDNDTLYYLDYGPVRVREEHFTIELDFQPPPGAGLMIHHLKFSASPGPVPVPKDEAELREMIESLKELGYDY